MGDYKDPQHVIDGDLAEGAVSRPHPESDMRGYRQADLNPLGGEIIALALQLSER